MVAFGIAVLVFGGMSTTLAGTITLNGNAGTVEFGQGVVTTAACDTSIKITPVSTYDTATGAAGTFTVSKVTISDIGISQDPSDTTTSAALAKGCLNKYFVIKAYSATQQLEFASSKSAIQVQIPNIVAGGSPGSNAALFGQYSGRITGGFSIESAAGFAGADNATSGGTPNAGSFTIAGLSLPSSVVRITLESFDTSQIS